MRAPKSATARRRCARWPSTSWALSAPTPGSGDEAARRFDASPIGGGSGPAIPADVESAILAVVAQLVRPGDYDALLERYRSAATPQEEMRSLGVLASFPDVDLCLRTFDLALTEVRTQNGFSVIAALLANRVGNQAVWRRITETWDTILERFPKNAPRVSSNLCRRSARTPTSPVAPSSSSRTTRWRRDPGASRSRPSASTSTWPSPPANVPGLPDALRAAGTHDAG